MISTPIKIILTIFALLGVYSFLIAMSPNSKYNLFSKIQPVFKLNITTPTPTPTPKKEEQAVVIPTEVPVPTVYIAEPTVTLAPVATSGAVTQGQDTQIIFFDGKSFSPNSVTVLAGKNVIFKNISADEMLVSSDPFPDSTDNPELNSKNVVKSGESFMFVAQKVGTWTYRDYIQPDIKGTLIVSEAK